MLGIYVQWPTIEQIFKSRSDSPNMQSTLAEDPNEPLASRIRPKKMEQVIGQEHLIGENKPLAKAIQEKKLFSFILWGPPGVGKTTLARIYADALKAKFFEISAVSAGKADIKKIIEYRANPKILFIDEIHRFNKAQQDYLLPFVEKGVVTLIGATTENPSFEIISALLSRCRVFTLHSLSEDSIKKIISRTEIPISEDALDWLARAANGDARQAITMLENTHQLYGDVTLENIKQTAQKKIRYDKSGEEHYNTVSAFIKSMRAGQADAAIYYLARMVEAGEDPKFIARRMVIFASEDVGLADPNALVVANEVFRAVEVIGLPEAGINLAHGVAYLASCKKDRRAYDAYKLALADASQYGNLPIPLKIRNPVTSLMKESGYGKGYEMYSSDDFLPEELKGKKYLEKK